MNMDVTMRIKADPVKTAQSVGDPSLLEALHGLKGSQDLTSRFIELVRGHSFSI